MKHKTAVLLINLGTPQSSNRKDVKTYLTEFLTDPRVITLPAIWRHLLVRGIIIPKRASESAKNYSTIWTKEGSPLMVHSMHLKELLQEVLESNYMVELAMRYQQPSISDALEKIRLAAPQKLIILPLFPQYASATTGSIHQKVMSILSRWETIPETQFISNFCDNSDFLKAWAERGEEAGVESFDHILFSFHGLPEKHILKADLSKCCLKEGCCGSYKARNHYCYRAQCLATARGIADLLKLPISRYSVAFQSRLGKDPWLQPYTSTVLQELAEDNKKRVLVFCPSFVCDCVETLHEIQIEYGAEFKEHGGEELHMVESLNTHTTWVDAVASIVRGTS